jgi:hypothetical protein
VRRNEGFKTRRLGGAGTGWFPFGAQQVRNTQEIVGEHGGADEKFEALSALGQTTLHATSPEQHRDAALDAGPEALSFFEGWTFLDRGSFGGFLSAPLGNTDEFDASLLAGGEGVGAVKAAVGAIELRGLTEGLLVMLERGCDVVFVGGVSFQHAVLSDQASGAFGEKDLVAELDGFLSLAPFDQVGVAFKDRIDFLITGDLLSFEHPAAGLIDDAVAQLAVVLDFFAERLDGQVVQRSFATGVLSLLQHLARLSDHLPADADELAVFGNQLVVPLLGAPALDLLHATAGGAAVVGKAANAPGKELVETPDQSAEERDRSVWLLGECLWPTSNT